MRDILATKDDISLLRIYCDVLALLKERGVVRTNNSPVADYAEHVVAQKLGLELAPPSQKSYDAIDSNTGERYQVKARRRGVTNRSLQLGVIRDLDTAGFEYLVAVVFNQDFTVDKIYKIPKAIIKEHARHSVHQNGHIVTLRGAILTDERVEVLDS